MQLEGASPAESVVSAVLSSWTADPWILGGLILTGWIYLVGWQRLNRRVPGRYGSGQAACFFSGLLLLALAVSSPLDAFGTLSLSVHMTQHLLLMMIVPPLVWLGAPALPLMHGLPTSLVRHGLGPFVASPLVQRCAAFLGRPLVCWLAFLLSTWIWHVPFLYELALRSPFWHSAEHVTFLITGLMFWWPVVQPWPARPLSSPWIVVVYLISADLLNTVFSALFTFADHVIYPSYALAPQLLSGTALDDQSRAGVIMWVPGSLIFLAPLGVLVVRALDPAAARAREAASRAALTAAGADSQWPEQASTSRRVKQRFDLLKVPMLAWVGKRWVRTVVQAVAFLLALGVVLDGFLGPDLSPINLAGVLPWTWARALMVFGLVLFGAALCWACPFTAARRLAERFLGARFEWPRALRSKWLAVGLTVLFLWAYEAAALWDRPGWTAALVLAYFVAAFVVDGLFRGAAFCKWVCPLGQFQFVCSAISPFEVGVRKPSTCESCSSHDCLRGNEHRAGCSLDLFLPEKKSSLDCTFCMDCVEACPHDNAGVLLTVPGSTLIDDPPRSSIGRLSKRTDLAVLALVLVWGGALNAAAMVGPVQNLFERFAEGLGLSLAPEALAGAGVVCAVGVLLALTAGVGFFSRSQLGFCRLAWALVPLGFAMWLAHFAMHFVTGWSAVGPALSRVLRSSGMDGVMGGGGVPGMSHAMALPEGFLTLQILALNLGLLLSLYLGWRIVDAGQGRFRQTLGGVLPFGVLALGLWLLDVWVLFQPMQMRGTMGMG
jgi:cytochrome c oxidase assembly factor CtaG